jgi:hypothetical protein
MARVKHDLRDQLERIGMITHIGPDRLYPTLPVALDAFAARTGEPADAGADARPEGPARAAGS